MALRLSSRLRLSPTWRKVWRKVGSGWLRCMLCFNCRCLQALTSRMLRFRSTAAAVEDQAQNDVFQPSQAHHGIGLLHLHATPVVDSVALPDWLRPCDTFERRHIGSDASEIDQMLAVVGCSVTKTALQPVLGCNALILALVHGRIHCQDGAC